MKKFIIILVLVIILISALQLFLAQILSAYLSKEFSADVEIKQASLDIRYGIKANSITINNSRGLNCSIESARLSFGIASIIRKGLSLNFRLDGIEISYPESGVVSTVTQALSLEGVKLFNFDYAQGEIYSRADERIIKALDASGPLLRLNADASIIGDEEINCDLKVLLSQELVDKIPESTRQVFFKKEGSWFKVELYLKGNMKRPSINFSTDLFKLVVR